MRQEWYYDGDATIDGYFIGPHNPPLKTLASSKEEAERNFVWQIREEYDIKHQLWKIVNLLGEAKLVEKKEISDKKEQIIGAEQVTFNIPK